MVQIVDDPEQPKRKKPASSMTKNVSSERQPHLARADKPEKKDIQVCDLTSDGEEDTLDGTQFRVVDLTSDSQEPKILAPLSPDPAMRQARVHHFEPKTPNTVDSASKKFMAKYSPVQGGPEEELDFTGFFSD
jgi:cytochrome oxidase Cu insertion factor (SCO1/SenC/PrrC family)